MADNYVYHYYAMTQMSFGVMKHFDGIIGQPLPLVTFDGYVKLKHVIAERDGGTVDPDAIIVCSLSLLSAPPPEPKGKG